MKKSYVYKITCKITGEYYFGSSFRANSDLYWGSGRRIKERISKYGKENFVKEILGEFDDRTIAHQVENQYIEKFRNDEKCLNIACDHKFGTYSNKTRAKIGAANAIALRGEKNPNFGKTFSEETRAKLSAAHRGEKNYNFGKHLSDEHKAKIGAANAIALRGKQFSDEHKAKLSVALRGKHRTEETRARISAATRGEKNPMYGKHWRKNPITGKREYYD